MEDVMMTKAAGPNLIPHKIIGYLEIVVYICAKRPSNLSNFTNVIILKIFVFEYTANHQYA